MATAVSICNKALARVGDRGFIDSLEEDTTQAEVAKVLFESTRDEVLESARWGFAARRSVLGLLEGASRSGWAYVYGVPSDCLEARYVFSGKRTPTKSQRVAFAIEAADEADARVLLTDLKGAELVYTARIVNPALFSPLFADALSWKLAVEFSMALPVRPDLRQQAIAMYEATLARAAALDMGQAEESEPDSEFVQVRG
jgi:hypothetical protein